MRLQFDNGEQKKEPVATVRVEVVDDQLIKVMINEHNVINIWGTHNGRDPNIFVHKDTAKSLGFNLEVA